ncbi:fimbria/pilus outer membrane usher protein [Serratia marcescens]|uniref:fimbria/pilus outer membrane usher protein n=1 Tax=Serratia marcescens TaxID=615 RepID=UPI0013764EA6|nr:fimbria/pilus outer membrane usher protein [Serratia marcescens]MBH3063809.1 fimbria/pilus outer membrane usher protein [Serratia marcescens]NCJ12108.1 fimbria/pilus outer membrane usher protein [Serratia marcescens]NDJ04664.1 fimbria/pilus outer membrane usher protein [Serratia marcescens]
MPIEGIAQTQSTVEVKQRGQTVYRSLLPAGPFSLSQLGGAIGGVETEVMVTGADGQQQRLSVIPISSMAAGSGSSYQFGVGRYRSYSDSGAGIPLLLLGEKHWQPTARKNMGLGGLLASRYKNVSWRWGMSMEGGDWLSLGGDYARGRRRGVQVDAQGLLALGRNVSLSVFSQWHSRGYRGADEVLSGYDQDDPSHPRMANSVSLSRGSAEWGRSPMVCRANTIIGSGSVACRIFSPTG